MSRITKQLKDFRQGMTPFINGNGIFRLEHFDTTTNQLRPYRELIASTINDPDSTNLTKMIKANGKLYAISKAVSATRPYIQEWDTNNFRWNFYISFGSDGVHAEVLHYYDNHFIGLWKSTHLYRTDAVSTDGTHCAIPSHTPLSTGGAVTSYTYYADFITHSKDGLCYVPIDNILCSYNGTTLSLGIALPVNFRITSIAEQGDYIMIVGYDIVSGRSTAYLWDRDSSLATLTGKYDLGSEIVYHNATLGGTAFSVSLKDDSLNSAFTENPTLIIRYLSGDKFKIIENRGEFKFRFLNIGGKFIDNNRLYFNAYIYPYGETTGHYVVFQLDDLGNLSIVQNMGINDAAGNLAELPGLIKDGEAFWIGGRNNGAWNTTTTYGTTSILETCNYSAEKLNENIDLVGVAVNFEPLPSGASVVVKTKYDNETAWTDLATFSTDGTSIGSAPGIGISTATNRRFRIESTGGAVINSFQVDLETKPNEQYN